MKKVAAFLFACLLCLGITACRYDAEKIRNNREMADAVEAERLTKILCEGTWVSADHCTTNTISFGFYTVYTTLTFHENGTCVYTGETYQNDQLTEEKTYQKHWEIVNGRVTVYPDATESDAGTVYYDYADGVLLGSAAYCDHPFSYTQS